MPRLDSARNPFSSARLSLGNFSSNSSLGRFLTFLTSDKIANFTKKRGEPSKLFFFCFLHDHPFCIVPESRTRCVICVKYFFLILVQYLSKYSDLSNKRESSLKIFQIFEDHFFVFKELISEYSVLMYYPARLLGGARLLGRSEYSKPCIFL